jgi:hypothetical protein
LQQVELLVDRKEGSHRLSQYKVLGARVPDGLCCRRTQIESLIWRDAQGSRVAPRESQSYD